ncbi:MULTISPECIES: ABC transporter permease [Gordonia]|uniref:ABC-type transport system involved in resistance to organic solvents, permease component n=1 Tax=Gordonia terrae C-6 TaxID=1316928 RepID=R7Y5Q8_9ACTN|nr:MULTISPECIES: ABC transporter permease [Gordonia]AFR47222.1 ABC-type transport system involved in resistance to organic solvents, permease component [Gordonia sp. KTR9]EON31325.1 ABC-type transport system involved in resistance to organic solvents, permease component [Gordonia terrae C-6]
MTVSALGERSPGIRSAEALRKVGGGVIDRITRSLATIGRSARLAMEMIRFAITDAISMRLAGAEVIDQMWKLFKVTALPALLMAVPIGAEVSVQVGGVMDQVGANSLAGAASGLGVVNQGAPMAAGLLMSGAAASAIASDLGARSIREEIEAMRVIGVNPVQRLIVPRFLAMLAIAPALCVMIIASGVAAGLAISANVNDVVPASFWQSFGTFATPTDLMFSVLKSVLFAFIVVVIASLRGLEAKGGPKGVANAVNASVVLSVLCIFMTNMAVSQLQAMFFPARLA